METRYLVACGTDSDDGSRFTENHFGESRWYDIWRVSSSEKAEKIDRVPNPASTGDAGTDELEHDEKKPGKIAPVLREKGVNIIMGRSIGPNVVKMRRKFAVVVSHSERIDEALSELGKRLGEAQELLDAGEERGHMILHRPGIEGRKN
ncbi:NifB/NifX family molybdenum-iron cluster-binding protein [Marispirochaeta sp.]|jgi:predicted Fe-Mo cluster-binding NifX family protein|uniref:NifB/NifX family molybdenum-iron cluster-binding protein n=1 Tax=Marispirochaeta sp. TaxID=2038653 RepID=UPI0029C92F4B|nr:NifB/NifX family molybdenum-iron cluster-binding protein [Marispirochaeta sp.]